MQDALERVLHYEIWESIAKVLAKCKLTNHRISEGGAVQAQGRQKAAMAAALDAWLHAITLRKADIWKHRLLRRTCTAWVALAKRRRGIADAVVQRDAGRHARWDPEQSATGPQKMAGLPRFRARASRVVPHGSSMKVIQSTRALS